MTSSRAAPEAKPAKAAPSLAPTPEAGQHTAGAKRERDRRPPGDDTIHWLLGGADGQPIQRKPIDAGYGDIVAAARSSRPASRSTPPGPIAEAPLGLGATSSDTPVQAKCAACEDTATRAVQHERTATSPHDPLAVQRAAEHGLAGANEPLPHRAQIQAAFGRHDISDVRTVVGGPAAEASASMGALAFTSGNRVGFRESPDLRLAAHEAAHVVQQRSGLKLPSNVSQPGDPWEQHADRVADAVVSGRSTEPLLDAAPTEHQAETRGDAAGRAVVGIDGRSAKHILDAPSAEGSAPVAVMRQPAPPGAGGGGTPALDEWRIGDVIGHVSSSEGLIVLSLSGEPWVTVRWTPSGSAAPDIKVNVVDFPRGLGVAVNAPFDLRVTVHRATEVGWSQQRLGDTRITHQYVARGHKVSINQHLPDGGIASTDGPFNDTKRHEGHPIKVRRDPELDPAPAPSVKEPPPFWWEFDRPAQLDIMAAAHPNYYWLGYHVGGKLRAYNLTEEGVQTVAELYRKSPDIAAGFEMFYADGQRWPSLQPFYSLFYRDKFLARDGAPGDAPECIVYRHGNSSFGRKSIDHDEARWYWNWLETRSAAQRAMWLVDDRGPFVELVAKGKSRVWQIDREYFELRSEFLGNVDARKAGVGKSWDELLQADFSLWAHYLRPALDRDPMDIDPRLGEVTATDSSFVDEAGERIFDEVHRFAWATAHSAIGTAQQGIAVYLDDQKLQALVYQFPFMAAEERIKSLMYLGVPQFLAYVWGAILARPEWTQMVAMGEEIASVSLANLRGFVHQHHKELGQAKAAIQDKSIDALSMEGEFGDQIRKDTYAYFGFKLDPRKWPHEDEAEQPNRKIEGATTTTYGNYGSETEYLFAQESARRARHARHIKYLLIGLSVVAAVLLVIFAAWAGALLAGLLFSTATTAGAIAFGVTEVVVSAAIVTAVGPALNTFIMSGGSLDPELYKAAYSGIGWQFLINLGTFGFFKIIGVAIRAAAVIGAGGEEAFAASRGWQVANTVGRIGFSGGSMFAFAIVSHRLQTGDWPKGESMNEIIFETGLSIILLELGSFAARSSMENWAKWAEAQRIGPDVVERMKTLRIEVRKLNMDTAAFGASPLGGEKTGTELLARQRGVITEQKQLLEKLRESFRTRPDAAALEKTLSGELAAIDARIAAIQGVEAFAKAEVRPAASGGTGDQAEFTYKRGQEQPIKDYYGEDKVKVVGDHLEVDFHGMKLVFRPATDVAAGILPDSTRNPDALKAWRATAAARISKILQRAGAFGSTDPALHDVAKADPGTLDAKKLRALEAKLARAEKVLDKLEKSGAGTAPVSLDRGTDDTETWRKRLAGERDRVVARAKMLGVDGHPAVKQVSEWPMNRTPDSEGKGGLKANTLQNYSDAIAEARKVVDGAHADRVKALELASGGKPADLDVVRDKLRARRKDVVRRSEIYGNSKSDYIARIDELRIGAREALDSLTSKEAEIAAAEARLDALAKKALQAAVAVHGADVIAEVRAGAGLEKLTDAQIGDIMRQLAGSGKLSAGALRGAMLAGIAPVTAAGSPIPLDKVVAYARNPEELDWVLDTFGRLSDQQVGGSFRLLRDAASSPDKWQGSVWQMELARIVIGVEKVQAFEVDAGGRVIDIRLRDGTHIEAKDWEELIPEKVDKQFFMDLEINTNGGTDAKGIKKIKWMMRHTRAIDIAQVRATMSKTLERFISEKGLGKPEADALRNEFKAATDLVQAPAIDRTQVVTPPKRFNPPLPPLPTKKKDDQHP